MGCLGFLLIAIFIWIWYLIYRYFGHSTIIENCMICEYPEHYTRNWFGEIWLYSFIWLPILIYLIIWLKNNWELVKKVIFGHRVKIIIFSIVTVTIIIFSILCIPKIQDRIKLNETYKSASLLMEDEDYLAAIKEFDKITDYKDSQAKISEIHLNIYEASLTMIDKENYNEILNQYLSVLLKLPEYEDEVIGFQKKVDQANERRRKEREEQLKRTAPFEGMSEYDVFNSNWGPPTEINKEHDYDSKDIDYRVKHFKWVIKDSSGRIVEIRSLMIKQGKVWGEPRVSNYYVN